ncbi:DNA polymerase III subunit delta [Streptococcus dentiloxodontae]
MIAVEEMEKVSKSSLPLITLITGDDLGQYSYLKDLFFKQINFDASDLTYSYFDMAETSYQEIEMDLESLPFFADEKVVILDHFQDLTTTKKTYLDDKEAKRFEAYLENPVDTTRLVILAAGKLDGKRRLVKLLKQKAKLFEATEPKEAELRTYFQKQTHQSGLVFDAGAFDQLLIKSNFDFSDIQKNISFLSSYKKKGNITLEDIAEAIPKSLQDNVFDLTQMIIKGQIEPVRALANDLRLQGEDEIKLIAIMLGQFRMFMQVKLLSSQGKNEQQIVSSLSDYLGRRVNPYQVRFALRDSRSLSLSFLKSSLRCLIETDYQIKTGVYHKDYLFDLALLKIAGTKT